MTERQISMYVCIHVLWIILVVHRSDDDCPHVLSPCLEWARRWLVRPILDRQTRVQWGQGNCPGWSGSVVDAFLLSRAAVTSARLFSSKLSRAWMVRACQPGLSIACSSSCLGGMPECLMLDFTQSLNLLRGLPWFRLPERSSPYMSCFGSLWSSIRIT